MLGPCPFPPLFICGFFPLLILYYFFNLNFGVKFYFLKKWGRAGRETLVPEHCQQRDVPQGPGPVAGCDPSTSFRREEGF